MNEFRLKSDEMMFFLDFNNTLVDYANEYDMPGFYFDRAGFANPYRMRTILAKALVEFEEKTGITPVICIVTNARGNAIDNNGYMGILNDLYRTFFYEEELTKIHPRSDVRRFFKYLMHYENDSFIKINPSSRTFNGLFEEIPFDPKTLDIRYIEQFRKKESVDRLMSVVDPRKNTSKFILFAGDSIKDDYPMKEIWTPEGISKIFIRPGKSQKLTYSVMREFCEAKGDTFSSINPKNGKKIICTDEHSFALLSPEDQAKILNFHSGDYVYLTRKNTPGLIEGIAMAADLISGANGPQRQMF
ncbi:MAG: hypothetical protein IKD36_00845 [Clostridia bacterium]|nr:hypothetical protein [Clostridia bacterium]